MADSQTLPTSIQKAGGTLELAVRPASAGPMGQLVHLFLDEDGVLKSVELPLEGEASLAQ